MKKLLLIPVCFLLLVLGSLNLSAQEWCWGADGRSNIKVDDIASPVATNRYGNAYITGSFENFIIFGNDTLLNNGDNAFIVKYNSRGVLQWAKNPVTLTTSESYPYSIVSDAEDNAYITGSGGDTLIFGVDTLIGSNGFFVKYSPTGQVLWAQSYNGVSLAIDKNGNICLATSKSLMKFNPNGTIYMSKTTPYPNADIAIDGLGNIYSIFSIDTNAGHNFIYIPCLVKYDSSGNLLWIRRGTLSSIYSSGRCWSVTTDNEGNSYMSGSFHDTISFGARTLISAIPMFSFYCMFLAKFDPNGNVLWAEGSKGNYSWAGTSLAKDKKDNIYMGGSGWGSDKLLFGGGSLALPNTSYETSFIIKLDSAGTFGSGSLLKNGFFKNGVAVDSSGNYCYLTGGFNSTDTIFCGDDTLFNGAGDGCYIARWSWKEPGCQNNIEAITPIASAKPDVLLYPNPNNGMFTIEFSHPELISGTQTIVVYNIMGQKVYSATLKQVQGDNTLDLTGKPSGIYLYRIISENGELIADGKFIIE